MKADGFTGFGLSDKNREYPSSLMVVVLLSLERR